MFDLVGYLRKETLSAHGALDSCKLLSAMSSRTSNMRDWFAGYQAVAMAYVETARMLLGLGHQKSCIIALDIPDVAKAFGADLAALENAGFGIPIKVPTPVACDNESEAAGALWCIHGSRHGASVLVDQASKMFGDEGRRFLSGMELQRDRLISERKNRRLTQRHQPIVASDPEAALEGALQTFAYFKQVADTIEGNAR